MNGLLRSLLIVTAIASVARAQDAATLEKEIVSKRGAFLAREQYKLERTATLNSFAVVRGRGTELTKICGDGTKTLLESKGAASWRAENLGAWASSGVPMRIEIRDLGLHGTGKLVSDDSWKWQDKQTTGPPASNLWSPGATWENVDIYDWPGPAILYGKGGENRTGGLQSTDREVVRIKTVSVSRCFAGPDVGPCADGIIHDLDVGMTRDWGLRLRASATNVDLVHLWGCGGAPSDAEPDRGAALIDGAADGSTGGNHYAGVIQVDACSSGVVSYAPSDWQTVVCQKIERTSFDVHKRCSLGLLIVCDMADYYGRDGHRRIGLRLRPTSSWCDVAGIIYATNAPGRDNSDAVAALLDGSNHTVTLIVYAPGATQPIVIGEESIPSGCTYNLLLAGDAKVIIKRLGKGNTFRVRSQHGYEAVDGEEKFGEGNQFEAL